MSERKDRIEATSKPAPEYAEGRVDVIHYIVMCIGMFARQKQLTRKEACNYLARYKGLDFSIKNYEVEHQLSLQDCVDDMTAICNRNGGLIL